MPASFAIKPSASIFRTVINGDDALAPASIGNIVFDAYGAKVHGMTVQGIVPFSSFGGPYVYQLTYPTLHESDPYYIYDFTFPTTFAYCPIAVVLFQKQDGTWTPQYSAVGGSVTVTAGFNSNQSGIEFYVTGNGSVLPSSALPQAVSYRLFGV